MKYFYLITIFLSSFLLFAIQPMIAKVILPHFGGGSAVWSACMLFFQSFLLIGYLYSYYLSKLNSLKNQTLIHGTLIITGLILMPLSTEALVNIPVSSNPFFDIFTILLFGIGVPYFILSSTAPLIQYWVSHTTHKEGTYRLYSVSNIAALLALFSYPLVIEYSFSLTNQSHLWSSVYAAFSVAILLCIYDSYKNKLVTEVVTKENEDSKNSEKPAPLTVLSWFLLSAAGVILLVSTTNKMTVNIPPIPFLWILPLAVYLLTYILCFFDERVYVQWYWRLAFTVCTILAVLLFFIGTHFTVVTQISLYLVVLLVACIICHGEIAKSKPDKQYLTFFYLVIAAGGCAGSFFTTVIATQIFTQYDEFIVGIALIYLLCVAMDIQQGKNQEASAKTSKKLMYVSVLGLTLFAGSFYFLKSQFNKYNVFASRNFYGTLQVKDITSMKNPQRRLIDGYTSHGAQSLQQGENPAPLSYYRRETGIGISLSADLGVDKRKVGIIGLGVGALAFYGQEQDEFVFYELNPSVKQVAYEYFDYLTSSAAQVKVKLGDARISLEQDYAASGGENFQLLIVDAFSSDAIPKHLLTKEAVQLYQQHLATDGMLAFHISNSYLDLKPIMRGYEQSLGMQALYFQTQASESDLHQAQWVIFTNNSSYLTNPEVLSHSIRLAKPGAEIVHWDDNYSSLLSVLKL